MQKPRGQEAKAHSVYAVLRDQRVGSRRDVEKLERLRASIS